MIGTWRWNAIFGTLTMVLTFLLSLTNDVPTTALNRSLYGFVVLFVLTYVIRWMLGTLAGMNQYSEQDKLRHHDELLNSNIDLQTPDDLDSLNNLLKS